MKHFFHIKSVFYDMFFKLLLVVAMTTRILHLLKYLSKFERETPKNDSREVQKNRS